MTVLVNYSTVEFITWFTVAALMFVAGMLVGEHSDNTVIKECIDGQTYMRMGSDNFYVKEGVTCLSVDKD